MSKYLFKCKIFTERVCVLTSCIIYTPSPNRLIHGVTFSSRNHKIWQFNSLNMHVCFFGSDSTCCAYVCHLRWLWHTLVCPCVCVCVCVCVVEELSRALWLRSTMLLLSRGDRSEPAVSRARWMSAAWVKMCFCLLSLGDFHSALSRAHSPGQGAPLLPPCAGESWQMYLVMIHRGATETRHDSPPLSPCQVDLCVWPLPSFL